MSLKLGIGLMSGTSGDGVDSVLARFSGRKGRAEIVEADFLPFDKKLKGEISEASSPNGSIELLSTLNVKLGKIFGKASMKLCAKAGVNPSEVDFIGSHGQTVRHIPGGKYPSTLQIGEPAEIAAIAGALVVSDFRQADMAVGGCGAPLAPLAHYELFSSGRETRVIQNLGGISNVTVLEKGGALSDVWGFDTGPANSLIDMAVAAFSNGARSFDKGGSVALKGKIDKTMLACCMSHPFYKRKPPKSTGKELFGDIYFKEIYKKFKRAGEADFLRTLSALTARSSLNQIFRFMKPCGKLRLILCGGGAFNKAVQMEMKNELGNRGEVSVSSEFGIKEKSVEALLMAILARRTLLGLPGNLPKVTGARSPAVLGKITRL